MAKFRGIRNPESKSRPTLIFALLPPTLPFFLCRFVHYSPFFCRSGGSPSTTSCATTSSALPVPCIAFRNSSIFPSHFSPSFFSPLFRPRFAVGAYFAWPPMTGAGSRCATLSGHSPAGNRRKWCTNVWQIWAFPVTK